MAARVRSRFCSSSTAPNLTAFALEKMISSKFASGPNRAAKVRRSESAVISMAGKRNVLAPSVSKSRHSGMACCWGRVTRTPTPCSGSMRSSAAQPLQQFAGADGQQPLGELNAQDLGVRGASRYGVAQYARSIRLRHQALERQAILRDLRVGRDRRLAAAAEPSCKCALRIDGFASRGVIESFKHAARLEVVRAAFDADYSLA